MGRIMGDDFRFDVFLSYARSDEALANELNSWLRDQGLRTFFDRSELRPGLRWIAALEEAIDRSDAIAILIGRHGIGNTQQYERELALERQTHDSKLPVIPVLMPGCENPPTGFLGLLTWIDLRRGDRLLGQTESLENLRKAVHREAVPLASIRNQICPYRGLEPSWKKMRPSSAAGMTLCATSSHTFKDTTSSPSSVPQEAVSPRWCLRDYFQL
jgi:TIR domain